MEGHICATIFRKSTLTKVHEDHKELKGDLADLMGHKTTTAEKFYRLPKKEACIEAANNLTSIMRAPKEVPVSDQDTPGKAENKTQPPESLQKEHFSWNEEDVAAIHELFAGEIKKESVTMAIVRDKYATILLCSIWMLKESVTGLGVNGGTEIPNMRKWKIQVASCTA